MEWVIRIKDDGMLCSELSKVLNTPDLLIEKKGEEYFLRFQGMESLSTLSEIKKKTNELLHVVNGLAMLNCSFGNTVRLGEIEGYENGKLKMSTFTQTFTMTGKRLIDKNKLYCLDVRNNWKACAGNKGLSLALQLFVDDHSSWYGLYKISEIIAEYNPNLSKLANVSKSEIKLLEHTANNFNAVGEKARHAKVGYVSPKKPMKIEEAQTLITKLLKTWVNNP